MKGKKGQEKVERQFQEDILSGMWEWRLQHPKATFVEIEAEMEKRIARLRALMLEEIIGLSSAADWPEGEAIDCPQCGAEVQRGGKQQRKLQASGGSEIEIEREYAECPACGAGFFPLDEELQLLAGSLCPHQYEGLVRLSSWMPFGKAAQTLRELLGVSVSKASARRDTEAAGAAYVALQREAADQIAREAPEEPAGMERALLSVDGAIVPLVQGEWAEVKTVVVGEVQRKVDGTGQSVVVTENLSYFSRLVDAQRFQHLALSELHRRGLGRCGQVAAVMDGADWQQGFVDYHRPDAVRILDFPHAGQRITAIGQVLLGEGSPACHQWIEPRLHQLKHDGPTHLLAELHGLQSEHPHISLIQENLAYLDKRIAQMQYPLFQQQGWPIGSGSVESANKLVVEARLKGAGMHWQRNNVDPLLALRNILCSDRWDQDWPCIAQRLRMQTWEKRIALRVKHRAVADLPLAA